MPQANTKETAGSKLPADGRLRAAYDELLLEKRVASGLLDLPKTTAWMYGVEVQEVRITRKGEEWLLMVKGERAGAALICFFNQATYLEAITLATTALDSNHATWFTDKYPPR